MDIQEINKAIQRFVLEHGERSLGKIDILGRSSAGGVYVEYTPAPLLDPENEGLAIGSPWALAVDKNLICRWVQGEEILRYDKILAKFRRNSEEIPKKLLGF